MTETVPKPETAVLLSEPWRTETEVFWSQVKTVSPSDVCVYIWYKANEFVQARRLKVPAMCLARLNFPIQYLSSYVHALKVHRKRK